MYFTTEQKEERMMRRVHFRMSMKKEKLLAVLTALCTLRLPPVRFSHNPHSKYENKEEVLPTSVFAPCLIFFSVDDSGIYEMPT